MHVSETALHAKSLTIDVYVRKVQESNPFVYYQPPGINNL